MTHVATASPFTSPNPTLGPHRQLRRKLNFYALQPPVTNMLSEVNRSLTAAQPSLHPKFFYDGEGSRLFDAITRTPEYYPTRTESAIRDSHAEEIRQHL